MLTVLTPSAAKELGRFLSQIQTSHRPRLTFRDLEHRARVSSQYVHNIVGGAKGSRDLGPVREAKYFAIGRAMCIPDETTRDLLLRGRVKSALEQHGLASDQVESVWKGMTVALAAEGVALHLDVVPLIAEIIAGPPCDGRVPPEGIEQ